MRSRSGWRVVARDLLWNTVLASALVPSRHRWRLLRLVGLQVQRCTIAPGAFIGGRDVQISPGCMVNYGVFFDGSSSVHLGRNVHVGMQAMFCTSSHAVGTEAKRAGTLTAAPITVGDGAWIGARAVILPGVTIGAGCIIAAGSIVTRDCAPNGLYGGNPAERIKDL